MDKRWKPYLLFHLGLVGVAAVFAVYAWVTSLLFPNGFFHCFMHDLMRLYCPFCGITRAFMALLRLQIAEAFRLNTAAMLAGIVAVVLDIRAFVILCRKSKKRLIPPSTETVAICYFAICTATKNLLMLGGIDQTGDLKQYWEGTALWQIAVLAVLLILTAASFMVAATYIPGWRLNRYCRLFGWLTLLLGVAIIAVLYLKWYLWLQLGVAVLAMGIFYLVIHLRQRRAAK